MGFWVAIVRCIWDQRNLIVFEQGVVDADEIVHLAQLAVWLRLKHGVFPFDYAFSDWILNLGLCLQNCR